MPYKISMLTEWDGKWKYERIWLFVDVRTMRVICSVKVKRKEDEGVTGEAFFQVWLPGLSGNGPWEWPKTWRLSWGSRTPFRSANIFAISQRYSSVILDPRIGDPRPSGPDIHNPWRVISRGIETPCRRDKRRSSCGRGIARCFIHQSWWWLIHCLISASGWRVQRGPLRTSGSAGSGVKI